MRRDGTRLFVEGTLVALRDPAGKLLGFSKVMRDVTEHKERESELQDALLYAESLVDTVREPLLILDKDLRVRSANRAFHRTFRVTEKQPRLILDSAPALISHIDSDLRYRLANDAYQRWFGVAPQDLIGRSVSDLLGASVFTKIQPHLQKVFAGEAVCFEERYFCRQNGFRTFQVTYTPDLNERGEVQGLVVLGSDSIARERAEADLRKSEERWRNLFERMSEGFHIGEMIYDRSGQPFDFRFLEVNPAFERLTGLSDATGKTVRELIPGIQQEVIERYARVQSTGEPDHFEIYVPELQKRWYEARARHTEANCFAVLFLDITERKNAESQLRESERRQAALVALGDQLRDLKDISSITLAAMKIVGTTLGVARAGYGKIDSTQEYVTIESDWTDGRVGTLTGTYRFKDFGEKLGERLGYGELINISDVSTDPLTASEADRWNALDIRAVLNLPLVENGRLVALLFVQDSLPRTWTEADLAFLRKVADRTWAAADRARALQELEESEEFTRSVLASSPDCVKVVDLEGRLLTMNEGGCRQMDIDDVTQHLQRSWSDFWGEGNQLAEQAMVKAQQGHTARFETFCATAKGTPKWWEIVVAPIRDASGKPVRILSLARDITERQRAERERDRLTHELKRSNEELSQFAHIAAHDLQSPLRGIISFAQLLERNARDRLSPVEREFLSHILGSALTMQELVEALLRFAQVGQGEIEDKPVEMDTVLDAALQSLQVQIDEVGAKITRGVLPLVRGDSVQLVQLLQNLLANALKYRRPEERPDIVITAVTEREHSTFAVEDNGEGIAADYLESIFEPLKRLHGAEVPGTGLGLSTCQRIVNGHGGRIWVESQPGIGSTFYFTLPNAS